MNHFLLYGHGGAYNHGAEAILKTTMFGLLQRDGQSEIMLSSHFPEQDKEFGIRPTCFLERDMYYVNKEKQEEKQGLVCGRYNREIYRSTIEVLNHNTVALSVGGDNYCYPAWHRWKCIHEEILKQDGRDILWSCSINPENIDSEMRETLATYHLITARESLTYQALLDKKFDNVVLCADVAFLLKATKVELPWNFLKGQTVAINISPLVMRREKKKDVTKNAVLSLMEYILEKTKLQIALIPHVTMPMDNDYTVLAELFEKYKETKYRERICLINGKLSATEYKYVISQCRFGVFARTHASIAAYSNGIPSVVIGYSVKAQGIAKDMGVGEYVLDIKELDEPEKLKYKFERLMAEEKEVRKRLLLNAEQMKCLASKAFEYLDKIKAT